jgi:general stress protein 26
VRTSPGVLPAEIEALLDAALVSELTVVTQAGRPVTYPLIPLYDGRTIAMTSAVLFSRKLEHLRANPKVSVALSDPVGVPAEPFARATVQGLARVFDEDDPHSAWERVLPLWRAKEPAIGKLVKQRFGLPLFFERVVIEISPVRALYWPGGDTASLPQIFELAGTR